MPGDLLLTNARISDYRGHRTAGLATGADGAAVDILIHDGRIASIVPAGGELASGQESTDPGGAVRSLDLDGRWLIPGLWDRHVHFTQWVLTSRRLDLSRARSAAEAVALVAERAAATPEGEAIIGSGFRDGLWPDAPHRAALDAVSGSHSVILVSGDLHACWLNSVALAEAGHADHPTGLLREDDAFAVISAPSTVATDTLDGWAADAAAVAASRGIVGIVDLEMAWNVEEWSRRIRAGLTTLRVNFGVYAQHLDRAIETGLRTNDVIDGTHGLLTVGPFKVITDGSLNTRTAYCFDEYPGLEGQPNSRGLLTVPLDELLPLLRRATAAGLTPAVHAIGDHANQLALDAFAELGCGGTLEHAQLLQLDDIARFAQLGVVASVQPEHAMDDRDVADVYWAGRTGRAFPLATMLHEGVELAFGSDAPVAPLDPWFAISSAVGRSRSGSTPWHPEQQVSTAQAIAASTNGHPGVIEGAVADLVVVDADPLTLSVEDLRDLPVSATLLAGRPTHSTL